MARLPMARAMMVDFICRLRRAALVAAVALTARAR